MGKLISPRVPSLGSASSVQDPTARQILQQLVDTHNARNGTTDSRFVTAAELASMLTQAVAGAAGEVSTLSSSDEQASALLDMTTSLQNTVTVLQSTLSSLQSTVSSLASRDMSQYLVGAAPTTGKTATTNFLPVTVGGQTYYLPIYA